MKTILVPLDGSPLAERVLPYAQLLATTLRARLHLLNVISPVDTESVTIWELLPPAAPGSEPVSHTELVQRAEELLREHADLYPTRLAKTPRDAGVTVVTEVQSGAPATRILETAEREPDCLVAMATHGYSGLRRWAVGSVTDKVVQHSATPIFVIPSKGDTRTAPSRLRRILVPLDGSDVARQALPVALELATAAGAEVILLCAIEPAAQSPGALIVMRSQATQELQAIADESAVPVAVRSMVVVGYPPEVIVDEAVRHEADMIVMATHGRGGIRRWTLGSSADKVLHTTRVPLLLVRSPFD